MEIRMDEITKKVAVSPDAQKFVKTSGNLEVHESIKLNKYGGATTVREFKKGSILIPQKYYQKELEEIKKDHGIEPTGALFKFQHQFLPKPISGYKAYDKDGNEFKIQVQNEFASTIFIVEIPVQIKTDEKDIELILPPYSLEVIHSRLAEKVGEFWSFQWSHGAPSETKYTLDIEIPTLRENIVEKLFYEDYAETAPLPTDEIRSHHKPRWQFILQGGDTFSIHLVYGKRYRKRIFSPIGILLTAIGSVILKMTIEYILVSWGIFS